MDRGSNPGLGSCCDLAEYFLRIVVIVSTAERRKEDRNYRGGRRVISMGELFWPGVTRGTRPGGGNRWGAGVIGLFSCVYAACRPRSAPNGGRRCVTDIQQAVPPVRSAGRGFRAYSAKHLDMLVQRAGLPPEQRLAVRAVATVLPFRTNSYVVENLIDWDAAPDDPIYRLVFPQPDMLPAADVQRLADMIGGGAPEAGLRAAAHEIRMRLNPHPAGQLHLNAPSLHGRPLPGLQHKYPETVLFFPRQGQTCHAYCTYCFRWAQFVDEPDLKMATDDIETLVAYLGEHPEVTSVLITGGDPMIMGEPVLRRYIEPLLDPRLDHLETIRIGTKSLSYWPQRYVTDPD